LDAEVFGALGSRSLALREIKADNINAVIGTTRAADAKFTIVALSPKGFMPNGRFCPNRDVSRYASAICASKLSEKATTSPRSGSGTLNVSSVTDKHRMNAA
jgi:hypothetical protein